MYYLIANIGGLGLRWLSDKPSDVVGSCTGASEFSGSSLASGGALVGG
jgi:hypothetical protein